MPALTSMLMNKTEKTRGEREREQMNMNERQIYQKHASFKYPPSSSVVPLLHPVIFYSLARGEFNKYMQMCAVEHDECKSGEDVL